MLRRFVSSLLIVGYVASQLAAVPHAHGAGTAAEHAQTSLPHFHFHGAVHDHDKEHHHQHDADGPSQHQSTSVEFSAEELTPLADVQIGLKDTTHDDDAIFLPAGSSSVLRGSGTQAVLDLAAFTTSPLSVAVQPAQAEGWSSLAAPAFFSIDGSGLYLTLRSLRL